MTLQLTSCGRERHGGRVCHVGPELDGGGVVQAAAVLAVEVVARLLQHHPRQARLQVRRARPEIQ